jgi:hypothetical protein
VGVGRWIGDVKLAVKLHEHMEVPYGNTSH